MELLLQCANVYCLVQGTVASRGSTDLWRPLHSLNLLSPTQASESGGPSSDSFTLPPRNVFVITDGHATEEAPVLAAIRKGAGSSRLFSFGVGLVKLTVTMTALS